MTARPRLTAVPDTAPRYAIAVRVSRVGGRSGERFLSPEIQTTAAARAIAQVGGVLDTDVGDQGVFYDLDVSGAVAPADRPGLGQALDLVRAGRLTGVVVYDLSRFSRDTAGGLRALEDIAAAGGHVLSASETIDLETPAGVFSTTVQLAAHRLRRDEASKSWKATHARRFEMGLSHGKLPFGYVTDKGQAVPDPVLGPALTLAFVDYGAGRVSQKALADRLGTLRGKPMRQGVISGVLRNRFYLGEVEFLGETKPGRHAALVDEETFAAVQRRLNFERAAGPHWRSPGSPAIGLVYCATCHGPLYRCGTGSSGGVPRTERMRCSGKMAGECEGIGTPLLEDVELALRALALDVARDLTDDAPRMVERRSRAARAQAEIVRLRSEERELESAIGELVVLRGRKVLTDRQYQLGVDPLERELTAVQARLLQCEGAEYDAAMPVEELRDAARRLEQLWPAMTPLEQRAALQVFLPRGVQVRRGYRGEPMGQRLLPRDEERPT